MKAIRTILACIRKADNTYNLINHGDKIVVGLSGGKDSIVLTYCLCLYQKFSHTDFTIQPVTLDLGFPGFDPYPLIKFCESLGLKLLVSDNRDVYKILKIQQKDSAHLPCSICSRMKKAAINKVANEIGFNKVAFAHHADDAIETFLMNEIYGARLATFAPKMHLEKADITFIRPLALAREKDISKLIREENLPVLDSHCPADKTTTREDIKLMLKDLYKKYPESENNFLTMFANYEHLDCWFDKVEYQVSQDGLLLKPVTTPLDMALALDIRNKVFVLEKGFPYNEEVVVEYEKVAVPFLIYLKDKCIGTIRYREVDGRYKVERFAILKEYRNKGYGKLIFNYVVEMIAAKFNPCTIYIHSIATVVEFYKKQGFEVIGDSFLEAGVEHYELIKKY